MQLDSILRHQVQPELCPKLDVEAIKLSLEVGRFQDHLHITGRTNLFLKGRKVDYIQLRSTKNRLRSTKK